MGWAGGESCPTSQQYRRSAPPDPELRTSPIFDDDNVEALSLDLELESPACYFNNVRYPIGQYARSGEEVLHCAGRGVWVRKGEGAA